MTRGARHRPYRRIGFGRRTKAPEAADDLRRRPPNESRRGPERRRRDRQGTPRCRCNTPDARGHQRSTSVPPCTPNHRHARPQRSACTDRRAGGGCRAAAAAEHLSQPTRPPVRITTFPAAMPPRTYSAILMIFGVSCRRSSLTERGRLEDRAGPVAMPGPVDADKYPACHPDELIRASLIVHVPRLDFTHLPRDRVRSASSGLTWDRDPTSRHGVPPFRVGRTGVHLWTDVPSQSSGLGNEGFLSGRSPRPRAATASRRCRVRRSHHRALVAGQPRRSPARRW